MTIKKPKKRLNGKNQNTLKAQIKEISDKYESLSIYVQNLEKSIFMIQSASIEVKSEINHRLELANELITNNETIKAVIEKVISAVCLSFKVNRQILFTRSRKIEYIQMRRVLYYICRDHFKVKEIFIQRYLQKIGFNIDRSTIYHALDMFRDEVLENMNQEYNDEIIHYVESCRHLNITPHKFNLK